ncbi:MAG TPA: alpha/beta fold hydrolase [Thermoanaerobaculia bacterium]|jgi:pimeloyl-ACP methyl ester carboxylesterase|nr:alpha/beta fold hydrolase [Thermoanaerobaculia bacterium]
MMILIPPGARLAEPVVGGAMKRRAWRSLWIAALAVAAAAALLEIVAAIRVRHLRAERAYLGGKLYVEVRGRGDPVVFLAGLPATTHFWQGAFDPLAKTHRLIFLDALGFGRSPLPAVDYTLEDHLGALRRTLVAQGATRRVTFIAHSFGTLLAAYYAARYPQEVEHLFLLGTPVFDGEREARAHIREMSSMGGLFTLNPVLAREACKLHEASPQPFLARVVPRFLPGVPPEVSREALLHTWRSFNGTLRNVVMRKPIAVPLSHIGPKVTFVHGRADPITTLERIQALAAATGAGVLITEDNHRSYPVRSAGRIIRRLAHCRSQE